MQRTGWNWIIMLALAIAWGGCRGMPRSIGLPVEHQIPTQQLVFHSDFPLPQDHRLIRELTAEREDVCRVLGMSCSEEPIHVYLFRDADAYSQYVTNRFPNVPHRRAFFIESDTRLAVYAHWSDRMAEDLRHEVAHGYMHAAVTGLPLWLDEGLAEYFEVPRGHDGLNRPHVALLADRIAQDWQPDLKRLEKIVDVREMEQSDYAESWAWVHFLLESEPDRRELLDDYLRELKEQGKAKPLSERLASRHLQPERTLVEYLVLLDEESEP